MNWLHHHRDLIAAVVAVCAVAAVVLTILGVRYARAARYERRYSAHAAPERIPLYGDTTLHDRAWDHIADELGDDYATESCECGDPYCSQFTHTGELPPLRPLPDVDTLAESGWPQHRSMADYYRAVAAEDLLGEGGPDQKEVRGTLAGEPCRHRQWTSLLGGPDLAQPTPDLPVPESHREQGALPRDGEPDVLEGVVVSGPLPEYGAEDWREFKEWLDASFAESWGELAAWSARQLEAAA